MKTTVIRSLTAAMFLAAAASLAAQTTVANQIEGCPKLDQPLQSIPEIVSYDGVLTGTLYTVSELQAFPKRPSGKPGSVPNVCSPQWVRAYRPTAPPANPSGRDLNYPMPGPTLRARVGDLVQLRFFNQIDSNKFPKADEQCDKTTTYPPAGETFPDCFSESVFTNVHYHGTHTNPNSTGDNVFLLIRPSPRKKDGTNAPVVTEALVEAAMNDVFQKCAQELNDPTKPQQWPTYWSDMPQSFRDQQKALLLDNDLSDWWDKNQKLIDRGQFPQFFLGSYPYCFRLPRYAPTTWPPPSVAAAKTAHTHGAGLGEVVEAQDPVRPLLMGQVPGTHWYHAHKHGSTTINVMNGMTGVFIIEGQYDDDINAYYGQGWTRTQKLLVIQQLGSVPTLETSGKGTESNADFSVNGQMHPRITIKGGEVQMWRIANTSARAGAYFHRPPNGFHWKQLAQDGVQFHNSNYQHTDQPILLASGNRADILIKAPAFVPGDNNVYTLSVFNTVDSTDRPPRAAGTKLTLVTVEVTPPSGPPMDFMPAAPAFPPYLADIADDEVKGHLELLFASSTGGNATHPTQHTIDGKKFDGEVGASVTLNRTEEWKIVNATYGPPNIISHPFHIHINPFQVTEIFDPNELLPGTNNARYVIKGKSTVKPGQCVLDPEDKSTWKPCQPTVPKNQRIWRDVFSIPSGARLPAPDGKKIEVPGYFKMRSRFVDYSGQYVLHCHILAHEDRGMMTVVSVVPLQTPLSHH